MTITRIEYTQIPQTIEGKDFADTYEKRLKEQLAFLGREENTRYITIKAQYYFDIKEE